MLTIKDILQIPFPEEQKELKPGYTVLITLSGSVHVLCASHFVYDNIYPIRVENGSYTIDGRISSEYTFPQLIVIDVPKIPKKIRLAPALVKDMNSGMISIKNYLYDSLLDAQDCIDSNVEIIWPAPLIGLDGFYEFNEEDWK